MNRSKGMLGLCLALGFAGGSLVAQLPPLPQARQESQEAISLDVFTGKRHDLQGPVFNWGDLVVTLKGETTFGKLSNIHLHVQNPTKDFLEFHPEDLVVVGADGEQNHLMIFNHSVAEYGESPLVCLAPKAFSDQSYLVSPNLTPPFTIYFGKMTVARIAGLPVAPAPSPAEIIQGEAGGRR